MHARLRAMLPLRARHAALRYAATVDYAFYAAAAHTRYASRRHAAIFAAICYTRYL